MNLGPRVREKRRALGFSQEHLAREAGVTWSSIQRLESGQVSDPHYSTLSSIAHALDTTVAELVGEEELAPLDEAGEARRRQTGPAKLRIARIVPTGRGPNVTQEMLREIGIEATDAELNALNILLENRARQRVEGEGPIALPTLPRDNVDAEKVFSWIKPVEDALPYWIAVGRFKLTPGTATPEEVEAVRRHTQELLTSFAGE